MRACGGRRSLRLRCLPSFPSAQAPVRFKEHTCDPTGQRGRTTGRGWQIGAAEISQPAQTVGKWLPDWGPRTSMLLRAHGQSPHLVSTCQGRRRALQLRDTQSLAPMGGTRGATKGRTRKRLASTLPFRPSTTLPSRCNETGGATTSCFVHGKPVSTRRPRRLPRREGPALRHRLSQNTPHRLAEPTSAQNSSNSLSF